jgi:hypothetical protein
MWGVAAFLLLLPAVAMQLTPAVDWSPGDFVVMAAMLAMACGTVELGARASPSWAYRSAVGIAVLASFLLVWMNLAAGIIGPEDDDPANLMFAGVVAVAIAGALSARCRARGMAGAMAAAAVAQLAVAGVALAGDMGAGESVWPWGFAVLNLAYTGAWLSSAWLFRSAARAAG